MKSWSLNVISLFTKWVSMIILGVSAIVLLFDYPNNMWAISYIIYSFIGVLSSYFIGVFATIVAFCEKAIENNNFSTNSGE